MSKISAKEPNQTKTRKPSGRPPVYDRDRLWRIWIWVQAAARVKGVRPYTFCRRACMIKQLTGGSPEAVKEAKSWKNIVAKATLHRRYTEANQMFKHMLKPDEHGGTATSSLVESLIRQEADALRTLSSVKYK